MDRLTLRRAAGGVFVVVGIIAMFASSAVVGIILALLGVAIIAFADRM